MKPYQLGVLLMLFTGLICMAIGLITGNAVTTNVFPDAAFSAIMWELAGILTGGGLLFALCSPIILLLLWLMDRTAPSSSDKESRGKEQ